MASGDDDEPLLIFDFDEEDLALPSCQSYLEAFPRSPTRQDEAVRIWLVHQFIQMAGRLPTSAELNGVIEDCRRYIRGGFWVKEVEK